MREAFKDVSNQDLNRFSKDPSDKMTDFLRMP